MVMAGEKIVNPLIRPDIIIPDRSRIHQNKHFNMCGYGAPKLETVRIGFIGLGNRGPGAAIRTGKMPHEEGYIQIAHSNP
jgi:hypothetical protein